MIRKVKKITPRCQLLKSQRKIKSKVFKPTEKINKQTVFLCNVIVIEESSKETTRKALRGSEHNENEK